VKQALDGEKIDEIFETFEVHGFKLSRPVLVRPPILLGALRPGMLRLAGREADGAILNWLGANDVAKCRAEVRRGKDDRGATSSSCPRPTPTSRE